MDAETRKVDAAAVIDRWGRSMEEAVLKAHVNARIAKQAFIRTPANTPAFCKAEADSKTREEKLDRLNFERDLYTSIVRTIRHEVGDLFALDDIRDLLRIGNIAAQLRYAEVKKELNAIFVHNRIKHSIILKVVSLMQKDYSHEITDQNRWKLITDLRRRHTIWQSNPGNEMPN